MTTGEWLNMAQARLADAGIESGRLEAQVLAAHILRVDRAWVVAHPDHDFPELAGESLLARRLNREPLAYILGYREFFGRRFSVRPGVLIPRQETETLVEAVLSDLPRGAAVLDLGTGSGCIGITLKLERPDVSVTLSDVSDAALSIARENAEALGADVVVALSDGFEGLLGEAFDRIVTNPPYIRAGDSLMPEVADHEPAVALYGGPTGLEFYELLRARAAQFLRDGGRLAMEVGFDQAEAIRALFHGDDWRHLATIKDLSGIERVLVFQAVQACRPGL